MKLTDEQYQDFVAKENELALPEVMIIAIIEKTIPIYTIKKPNPKTGEKDCNITKHMKEQRRKTMKGRLIPVWGDQKKVDEIVKRYAKTEE